MNAIRNKREGETYRLYASFWSVGRVDVSPPNFYRLTLDAMRRVAQEEADASDDFVFLIGTKGRRDTYCERFVPDAEAARRVLFRA